MHESKNMGNMRADKWDHCMNDRWKYMFVYNSKNKIKIHTFEYWNEKENKRNLFYKARKRSLTTACKKVSLVQHMRDKLTGQFFY